MRIARHLAIVLGLLALVASPLVLAGVVLPTPIDWIELRFERGEPRDELAGREQQGRTEMEFLAQYEKLRTPPPQFRQGYRQGRSLKEQQCAAIAAGRVADAQALARGPGQPVDVIVC